MHKFLVLIFSLIISSDALAQVDIFVRGSAKLFPIALPQLCIQGEDTSAGRDIPQIISRDLDLSGFFEVISPAAYIETPGKCSPQSGFAYSDWSVIGAEGLVRGIVTKSKQGIRVQLFLHDVQRQAIVLGKEYEGDDSNIPRIAHKFANEIMRFFTGEAGPFGSQIAFSSRVGRFKELFMMDMDGANIRQLTSDRALAVSPAWDSAGKKIVYTSYRNRQPDLFVMEVAARSNVQITRGPALEISAHFAPSGANNKILVSRTEGRDSDIVMLNSDGTIFRHLTRGGGAIDVSPTWSPDGRHFAFCSNRAGGPQIYVSSFEGGSPTRISFVGSNYCTSPSWSPKGDRLAFVCRADGGFQIFTSNPDGSDPVQLTAKGDNEDPDWSPDGRYLAFATTQFRWGIFSLAIMRKDGSNMRQISQSRAGDFDPSWGPVPH